MKARFLLVALHATLAAAPGVAVAGPGLLVTPQRVVLEARDREATITVSNSGDTPGGFRLFFTNYEMSESGSFAPVTDGARGNFADRFVRFSPRQVVLAPGETQVVRLSVRKPAGLAQGEYRSHLVFQGVPRKGESKASVSEKGKARAAITTLYGISIPVIVRHRTTGAKLAIAGAHLEPQDDRHQSVVVELRRTGDESVYGDVRVAYRKPGAKDFEPIGESNGNAVYLPLERRYVRVPIGDAPLVHGGTLRIIVDHNNTVLASKDVPLE